MSVCICRKHSITSVKEQFVLQVLEGGIVLYKNNEVGKFDL